MFSFLESTSPVSCNEGWQKHPLHAILHKAHSSQNFYFSANRLIKMCMILLGVDLVCRMLTSLRTTSPACIDLLLVVIYSVGGCVPYDDEDMDACITNCTNPHHSELAYSGVKNLLIVFYMLHKKGDKVTHFVYKLAHAKNALTTLRGDLCRWCTLAALL